MCVTRSIIFRGVVTIVVVRFPVVHSIRTLGSSLTRINLTLPFASNLLVLLFSFSPELINYFYPPLQTLCYAAISSRMFGALFPSSLFHARFFAHCRSIDTFLMEPVR